MRYWDHSETRQLSSALASHQIPPNWLVLIDLRCVLSCSPDQWFDDTKFSCGEIFLRHSLAHSAKLRVLLFSGVATSANPSVSPQFSLQKDLLLSSLLLNIQPEPTPQSRHSSPHHKISIHSTSHLWKPYIRHFPPLRFSPISTTPSYAYNPSTFIIILVQQVVALARQVLRFDELEEK